MTRTARLLVAIGVSAIGCARPAPAPAPAAAPLPAAPAVVDAAPAAVLPPEPPDEEARPDAATETVTIKLVTDERKKAHVFWGRKDLGVAPLEVTRPRASGPMDLLVVAEGYLPLHTRVFTERNETLALRVYDRAEATKLPGYSPSEANPPSAKATVTTPTTKPSTKTSGATTGSASKTRR